MVFPEPQSAAPVNSDPVQPPDLGFGREARLLTAEQFARVFKNNRRSSDKFWTLLYTYNDDGHPRLGMAVAKKKIKRAVDRNRVKRVVRESFRTSTVLPPVDIVVLPSANCRGVSLETLRDSLDEHWARIALKCASR